MTDYNTILVEKRGAVTLVTLNRPQALNALNSEVLKDLIGAFAAYDADDSQRCLVLTGSRLGLASLLLSLVALGVLAIRGRLLSPQARKIALLAGAVLLVGIVLAGRPLLRRLVSSGAESYSAQFRTRTWSGAGPQRQCRSR